MKENKITKISGEEIVKDKKIYSLFENKFVKKLNFKIRVLCCDFYMDTLNYYPITKADHYTFPDWFDWQFSSSKFYTKEFKKNFFSDKFTYKKISNAYIIGSSPGNNYFRNIYTFFHRLFFIEDKEVNIAIHRNTSNSLRNFIKYVLELKKIKLNKFIYLDNGFYLFSNCKMPSFLDLPSTIKSYAHFFPPNKESYTNIYISRRNAQWRKIINEADFINHLEEEGFQILDLEALSIPEQIIRMQTAKKIIAPHGSGLTNLLFAHNNIQVIEIVPKKIDKKLMKLYLKYKKISDFKKNKHYFFAGDLIENDNRSYYKGLKSRSSELKVIYKNIIGNNPYYKNFIVQEGEFKKLITNFSTR